MRIHEIVINIVNFLTGVSGYPRAKGFDICIGTAGKPSIRFCFEDSAQALCFASAIYDSDCSIKDGFGYVTISTDSLFSILAEHPKRSQLANINIDDPSVLTHFNNECLKHIASKIKKCLDHNENLANQEELELILAIVDSHFTNSRLPSNKRIQGVQQNILDFANEHAITLANLLEKEGHALSQLIIEALTQNQDHIEEEKLQAWMNGLRHAVAGTGEHVRIHTAASSGMAADLINNKKIQPHVYGTDLDIRQCMRDEITDLKKNTLESMHYVLTPISLTESTVPFETVLREAIEASKKIVRPITISVPVNCGQIKKGGDHWRLASATITHGTVTAAELWDPLSGESDDLKSTPAYHHFSTVLSKFSRVEPTLIKASVQHNDYDCAIYIVQEAYRRIGQDNAITAASDAGTMRLAFVKQIAAKHVGLGEDVAMQLSLSANGKIDLSALDTSAPIAAPSQLPISYMLYQQPSTIDSSHLQYLYENLSQIKKWQDKALGFFVRSDQSLKGSSAWFQHKISLPIQSVKRNEISHQTLQEVREIIKTRMHHLEERKKKGSLSSENHNELNALIGALVIIDTTLPPEQQTGTQLKKQWRAK